MNFLNRNRATYSLKTLSLLLVSVTVGFAAQNEFPTILAVREGQVALIFPREEQPRVFDLADLPAADQEAIAIWVEEQKNKPAEAPVIATPPKEKEEEVLYNPNASYRERQQALTAAFKSIPDNFDDEWPKLVTAPDGIQVSLVSENDETRQYVYHSDHYEFICDVPLKPHLVERFAVLFEGTREVCRQLPIATKKAHVAGKSHRNRVLLFEDKKTYVQNGAPPSSAGVYIPSSDTVMVPLTSVGVRKVGSSYSVDYDGSNKVLPHELTHQLTDPYYYQAGARGWFSEGFAEYVANIPYRSGKFLMTKAVNSARDYATEFGRKGNGGRAMGDEISAPSLKSFMLQSYSSFTGSNANFNYGLGLLITTYFFEMENGGDRVAITAFLKALREGKTGEDALAVLRQGRSFDEMADDISSGWRSKGVKIEFAPSGS